MSKEKVKSIKIQRVVSDEIPMSEIEKSVAVTFRKYEDARRYGFATAVLKTPVGNIKLNLTVWRSKWDGSPRIFWKETPEGYTTSVYENKGYAHASEGAVDASMKSVLDQVIAEETSKHCKLEKREAAPAANKSKSAPKAGDEEIKDEDKSAY